jgi:cell division protein FtsB
MRKNAAHMDARPPLLKRAVGPVCIVFAIFYLGFHAVSGDRGLYALFSETRKLQLLEEQLAEVKSERQALEHKVKLLSNQSLDLDLLDEQVRRIIGMTGKDEIVYFLDEEKNLVR